MNSIKKEARYIGSEPTATTDSYNILLGDCRQTLASLPDACVQTCITSPPYFGLRSYMPDGVRLRDDINSEEMQSVLKELEELGIKPI